MGSIGKLKRTTDRVGKHHNMAERLEFADRIEAERRENNERWYDEGGQLYIDWTKEFYRTYTGSHLSFDEPHVEEIYLIFGNPWFVRLVFEKAAQMGFTECMIAFSAFALAYLHIALGVGFETNAKSNEMVGLRIQPAFDFCPPIQELAQERRGVMGRGDVDNKSSLTVGGVTANFFYGKLPGSSGAEDDRQAPSKLSSFTAQMILGDEYELWSRKVLDIVEKRMQASTLPTRPMRYGSTPGAEGGLVDTDVRLAEYLFQWFVVCPCCQTEQFLDPFGNFLKAVEIEVEGELEFAYIDPTARPLDWFHHDPNKKRDTAYIGCSNPECGAELTRETLDAGHFRCRKNNISLREVHAQVLKERNPIERAALRMPMLVSRKFDPVKSIKRLFNSVSPVDEIQQGLGKPASFSSGGIAYKRIEACIGLPLPTTRKPDLVMLVMDVGRYGNPGQVLNWYYGEGETPEERWLNAHVEIVWYGKVKDLEEDVYAIVKKYQCHIVAIDNEPEFHLAASLALRNPVQIYSEELYQQEWSMDNLQVFLYDQMELSGGKFKHSVRDVSNTIRGQKVVVYNIDRTWCIDQVKSRIYSKRLHFPPGLTYDPEDPENNLISHFLSSTRTTDARWKESKADHHLLAQSAAESIGLALFSAKPANRTFRVFTAKDDG